MSKTIEVGTYDESILNDNQCSIHGSQSVHKVNDHKYVTLGNMKSLPSNTRENDFSTTITESGKEHSVSWTLAFNDASLSSGFEEFCQSKHHHESSDAILMIIALIWLVLALTSLYSSTVGSYNSAALIGAVYVEQIFHLLVLVVAVFLFVDKYHKNKFTVYKAVHRRVEYVLLFSMLVAMDLMFMIQIVHGKCENEQHLQHKHDRYSLHLYMRTATCNSMEQFHDLPPYTASLVALLPVMISKIFHSLSRNILLVVWSIQAILIVGAVLYMGSLFAIRAIIMLLLPTTYLLYTR